MVSKIINDYKCKCCHRQFVLNNQHTKTAETKVLIERGLKERISLRALTRIFCVSLNWVQDFARHLWEQTPDDLGISAEIAKKVQKVQIFGLQADEMWSFVHNKENKRWIWIVYDPVKRLVVACHLGNRSKQSAQQLWDKIPPVLRTCNFETDDWEAYRSVIPPAQHKVGKDLTYHIEGFMATTRARVSRLVRKALSFSKLQQYHDKAIAWFF